MNNSVNEKKNINFKGKKETAVLVGAKGTRETELALKLNRFRF